MLGAGGVGKSGKFAFRRPGRKGAAERPGSGVKDRDVLVERGGLAGSSSEARGSGRMFKSSKDR